MVWYPSGAPVPLELSWPGGFGMNVLALAGLVAAAVVVAISTRELLRSRRAMPLLTLLRGEKRLRRATA